MILITWNIQWGRGVDGRVDLERIVRDARTRADFDVLCLQEVADNFAGLPGNGTSNQFARLAALLPGFTPVEGIALDVLADSGGHRKRFGNMILSRLPVASVRRHALPQPADAGTKSMPRMALTATLLAASGPVRVTTTHLEYYSPRQRLAQAQALRALHDEACGRAMQPALTVDEGGTFDTIAETRSAILTADFNFRPTDPEHAVICGSLTSGGPAYVDAWQVAHPGASHQATLGVYDKTQWPDESYCADMIFVSEDLRSRVARVEVNGATQASDHQPVLIELR